MLRDCWLYIVSSFLMVCLISFEASANDCIEMKNYDLHELYKKRRWIEAYKDLLLVKAFYAELKSQECIDSHPDFKSYRIVEIEFIPKLIKGTICKSVYQYEYDLGESWMSAESVEYGYYYFNPDISGSCSHVARDLYIDFPESGLPDVAVIDLFKKIPDVMKSFKSLNVPGFTNAHISEVKTFFVQPYEAPVGETYYVFRLHSKDSGNYFNLYFDWDDKGNIRLIDSLNREP